MKQPSGDIISIKRFLARKQQEGENILFLPVTPLSNNTPHTPRDPFQGNAFHRDDFNKPTACGHRPMAPMTMLTLAEKRLQKAVEKAIVLEFSPRNTASTTSDTDVPEESTQLAQFLKTLSALVLQRGVLSDN